MRSIVFKTWLGVVILTGVSLSTVRGQESALLDDVKIPLLAQADVPAETAPAPTEPAAVTPVPAEVAPVPAATVLEDVKIPEAAAPAAVPPPVELIEVPAAPVEKVVAPVEAVAPVVPAEPVATEAVAPVEAAEPTLDSAEAAKVVAQQVEVRKREQEIKALKALADANIALKKQNYAEAARLFQEAVANLPVRPNNVAEREQALRGLSEAQYYVINDLISQDKIQEAFEMAKAAHARDPENRKIEKAYLAASEEVEDQKAREDKARKAIVRDPWRGPEVKANQEKVERLIREGRGFLAINDVKTAADKFGSALSLDPENKEAMRYLEKTGAKRFASSTAEFKATSENMVADVRKAWNPRDYVYIAPTTPTNVPGTTDYGAKLMEKMEKIMIPSIEFRQANIHDVVDFLVKASIAEDTTTEKAEDKGVNIILNLGTSAGPAAAPAPSADPFAPAAVTGGASISGVPEITFTARYISLMQAIKIITSVAGLKYRVEEKIVMIVPADAPEGEIVHKWYSVEPTFLNVISTISAPGEGAGGGGGSPFEAGSLETRVSSSRGDVEDFFRRMGVEMPKGSSVLYQPTIGKLIVANTSRNLAVVERILQEINVVPKQVEIEARFVEVNQSDLEELGFQWLLNDNWEVLTKQGSAALAGGAQRIQINKNSGSGGFTSGLRFWDNASADLKSTASGTMGAMLTVQSVLTNPELSMVLHLMEQNGHADVLSAPKVTTRSGSEATMRVVTEYIYPTEFDIISPTAEAGGGSGSIAIVDPKMVAEPQNFETREVGVILSVIPEVSPEGNMINLNMRPEVVSDPTWHEYGVTLNDINGEPYLVSMPQPFFQRRSVETQISIYDGATVVMGGLITEKLITVNDKIPFLGDIPLIGALFRNKGSSSEKRNLMIFVTARLVDPAGKPIRTQKAENQAPVGVPAAATATR